MKRKRKRNRTVTLYKLHDRIYHLKYQDIYYLTFTFMRISSFYESGSNIHNRKFTLEEFIDDYVTTHGSFSYFEDWAGYNLPGELINKFYKTFGNDLTQKEIRLYNILETIPEWRKRDIYIMAASRLQHQGYFNHELAHAMYKVFPDYKKEMDKLTEQLSYRRHMHNMLIKSGYNKTVINDEIQAYMATSGPKYLINDWRIMNPKVAKPFRTVFNRLRRKYIHRIPS